MGKGAYVLTQSAIEKKRNTIEQAKIFKNWFALCTTVIEMANTLPKETKYEGNEFPEYRGKPFRELLDMIIVRDFPEIVLMKDNIEMADEKKIKEWYFRYIQIIERAISDYVHHFHKQRPGGLS